jgi:hypothetical protein
MRARQSVLVLGMAALAAALAAAFVAFRSAASHRDVMRVALQRGLERTFDEAVAGRSGLTPETPFSIPTSALRTLLLRATDQRPVLPTFINSRGVLLPRDPVLVPSDQWFCVVRLDETRFYGITAKRACREVSRFEIEGWPHELLATNPASGQR